MSIIHVQQIRKTVESMFDGMIDVSDLKGKPKEEQESAFLTRSLAAFALMTIADIKPEKAAACVTDGPQDNGIDAVFYDDVEKALYLCQSKWKHDGKGSIDRGEVQKYIQGVTDIVNARFERFNKRIRSREEEIKGALYSATTRIVLLIAYTGQEPLSPEVQRDLDDLLADMNDPTDVVQLRVLRQGNLHGIIASGTLGAPIHFDVVLHNWGQVVEPYLAYFGQVAASEVVSWWEAHHPRLFAPNLRVFLGLTEINQSILETLDSDPEHFWYFNNGITALCESIKKKPIGGSTRESGVFECTDVRIVNGAQTVGAIALANSKFAEKVNRATVMVRFISLEKCPPGFSALVTRATNTQNRIERRDFVSLDPEQERLRTELQLEGIDYVYKSGDSPHDKKSGFDLSEATIALACSDPDIAHAVQAKREIGKLWEDITKPPYKALFNPSVSSRRLWRLVQTLRFIDGELKNQQDSRAGRDGMFAVHGNRFLTHLVYQRLPLHGIDEPGFEMKAVYDKAKQIMPVLTEATIRVTNSLYPESYLSSLFKNLTKCRKIEEGIEREESKALASGSRDT